MKKRPPGSNDARRPETRRAASPGCTGSRIWNREFVSIFVANSLMSIGLQMANILIGQYANSLGATATLVGVVSSAFAWASIVFKLLSGPVLDSSNRKRVIMVALGATGTAFIGCSLSTSVLALILFRLLEGAGLAFTTTAFIAMAADALPAHRTSTGLGFYALAAGIAQMIGPVVSLNVASRFGYRFAFLIAAGFLALSIFAVARIRVPYRPIRQFRLTLDTVFAKEALIPAGTMVLVFCCYSLVDPFLPIFAKERGIGTNISLFFTVYAAGIMLTRPLAGWLADRFGYMVLIPMFSLFIAAFWVISVSHSLTGFIVAGALFACGYGGCQPVLQSLAMRIVPPGRRGAASSTNFIGSDAGKIVGPILGGGIADAMGFSSMWKVMSATVVGAGLIVLVSRNRIRHGTGGSASP